MKNIVLYDNTNDYEKRDTVREYLFSVYSEENNWLTLADVPDDMIYDEIDEENICDWQYLTDKLDDMFDGSYFLLTGYCGRWNGTFDGGKFITTKRELLESISHLDYLSVIDSNGHLIIDGYHHDGSDHYELKKLTKKGYEYADKHYFSNSRQLHKTIMHNNFYSCLPRLASL